MSKLLSEESTERIKNAISEAELNTSGEIKVCIVKNCNNDILEKAWQAFYEMGMEKTALQNGTLLYLSLNDKKFAIIGDKGIHEQVGTEFWDEARDEMLVHFKSGNTVDGIVAGIHKIGNILKVLFPYQDGDKNELSDDVVFGD